jgi:hypothetical protein
MTGGKMNRTICAFIALFMGISTLVFARTEKTINEKNEYGGKTLMVTYAPGDEEYKYGKSKDISYSDSKGKTVKEESFSTDEFARQSGMIKTVVYSDSDGKMVKAESFFTDESARRNGVSKGIAYYDSNVKMVKESCYDTNGKEVRCP